MLGRLFLGSAAATLAGLSLYSDRAVRRAEARHPPVGLFVSVDGARLHFLKRGSGRPVVLLHASDLTLQDFTLSIFDQVAAAYQAIAFDRPGYGSSERPAGCPLTLALSARLIRDALQALGVERPILVGHSGGGSVALRYALDYPDEIAGLVFARPQCVRRGVERPRDVLHLGRPGAWIAVSAHAVDAACAACDPDVRRWTLRAERAAGRLFGDASTLSHAARPLPRLGR